MPKTHPVHNDAAKTTISKMMGMLNTMLQRLSVTTREEKRMPQ